MRVLKFPMITWGNGEDRGRMHLLKRWIKFASHAVELVLLLIVFLVLTARPLIAFN